MHRLGFNLDPDMRRNADARTRPSRAPVKTSGGSAAPVASMPARIFLALLLGAVVAAIGLYVWKER